MTVERPMAGNIRRLTLIIAVAFLVTSIGVGYWSLVAAAQLNADPYNPRLLASVSLPNYDANVVVDPQQQDVAWQQLNENKDKPLINRVAQGLYPPGSTMKIVTAAAALESGFDPNQQIRVDDPYQADKSWG